MLTKVAIDEHIARGDLAGSAGSPALYLAALHRVFVLEFVQTWTMQMIGQRIMFDMRMADLRPPAAARRALLTTATRSAA